MKCYYSVLTLKLASGVAESFGEAQSGIRRYRCLLRGYTFMGVRGTLIWTYGVLSDLLLTDECAGPGRPSGRVPKFRWASTSGRSGVDSSSSVRACGRSVPDGAFLFCASVLRRSHNVSSGIYCACALLNGRKSHDPIGMGNRVEGLPLERLTSNHGISIIRSSTSTAGSATRKMLCVLTPTRCSCKSR